MTESFSHYEIEDVIIENRKTVEKRGEPFGVDREILSLIFDNVNSYIDLEDKRARISRKVAYLLGGISYHQPFNNGNKETALAWTIYFLRKNGFDLPRRNLNEKRELYDLMIKTSFKFENDPTIITEVEEYLLEKILPY